MELRWGAIHTQTEDAEKMEETAKDAEPGVASTIRGWADVQHTWSHIWRQRRGRHSGLGSGESLRRSREGSVLVVLVPQVDRVVVFDVGWRGWHGRWRNVSRRHDD